MTNKTPETWYINIYIFLLLLDKISYLRLFNLFNNWYNGLYINVSSADINHINFETLAKDLKFLYLFSILYKLSCLASSSFGHYNITHISEEWKEYYCIVCGPSDCCFLVSYDDLVYYLIYK